VYVSRWGVYQKTRLTTHQRACTMLKLPYNLPTSMGLLLDPPPVRHSLCIYTSRAKLCRPGKNPAPTSPSRDAVTNTQGTGTKPLNAKEVMYMSNETRASLQSKVAG
jgi:hypothetical protein